MNVVDVMNRRMANIEIWEDLSSVREITAQDGNYSHFNEYKHLELRNGGPIDNPLQFVNDGRQRRVDAMPPARSSRDIMVRLSDPMVFSQSGTLVTVIVNGTTGSIDVWCCGVPPMASPDKPVYSWNMHTFFQK